MESICYGATNMDEKTVGLKHFEIEHKIGDAYKEKELMEL